MPNNLIFAQTPENISFEQMNAIITFRTVWLEMATWMRNFVYSLADDHPNLPVVTDRLYRGVPLRFYNAFIVFYGPEIAEEYLERITQVITIFWRLVDAMKNKNQQAADQAAAELYRQGEEGAAFLAGINDYWEESRWKDLYTQFIHMGIQAIMSILEKNYENEIRIFDRIKNLTVVMGNYMASGILEKGLNQPASMMSPVAASTAKIQYPYTDSDRFASFVPGKGAPTTGCQ